jgi:hypothetical protein
MAAGGGAAATGGGATGLLSGVLRRSSEATGTSAEVRDARATTPGVKVGVGLRDCCGAVNGVENGMEGRGAGGVDGWDAAWGRAGETARAGGSNASGAASASDSRTAREAASQLEWLVAATASSMPTRITAPQTEQRARTPPGGTFAGSTRKTDWHSAHVTFNAPPLPVPWRPA